MIQGLLIRILENEDTSVAGTDQQSFKVGTQFVSSLHNALFTTVCQRRMEDFVGLCHSKKMTKYFDVQCAGQSKTLEQIRKNIHTF